MVRILVFSGVVAHQIATAQNIPSDSIIVPSIVYTADTLLSSAATKSPGLAVLLSAVVPGSGQAYNESYWKIPIVLGFGAYFAGNWLENHRLYKEYRSRYTESLLGGGGGDGRALTLREFYRDQRDTFAWYFAILYLLNVADAFVDAHLYEFDVGPDLSLGMSDRHRGIVLSVRLGL
jgi:hypothetical protein